MAKVRTKKEHRKRVAKRNNILQQEKKRFEKVQKEFFMKIIEEEKNKGLFNNPTEPSSIVPNDLPTIGSPSLGLSNGPQI
jgi:hypothetical protein